MKTRHALAAAALLAWSMVMAGSATAVPVKNQATVIGNVRIDSEDPTVGYVTARYICQAEEINHLWVSVKQTESGQPDPALQEEGSSEVAATWSQSHPVDFVCNGKWQVQTFAVHQEEPHWFIPGETLGHGELHAGQGWVQFCLTGGTEESPFFAIDERWAAVG